MSNLALLRPGLAPARVVLVGGVPGAGKSTALALIARDIPSAMVLDPDQIRELIRRLLPDRVPHRAYRPLVHAIHAVRVLAALLSGPVRDRTLLVHDPATRPRRRWLFAWFARRCGWDPVLVFIEVSRAVAEQGQAQRGRVLDADSFRGHWSRWERLRSELGAAPARLDTAQWTDVVLTDRSSAVPELLRAANLPHNHPPVASGSRNSGPERVWWDIVRASTR
jgi:predicted kinase